ncbi:MAG: cytochrome c maturation protein CcmE [Deltaproteobacteria bacterium]|nr:cytochrome c maturation protein CcmE [Deltaproteobacteria bacterium]
MKTRKNQRGLFITAFLLIGGGIVFLVFTGLRQDSVYFLNVSEALAMETSTISQARLFGTVAGDGIDTAAGGLGVDFNLVDKVDASKSLRVSYRGAIPDTFKPGVEVIVEGGFDPGTGRFQAGTLLTKCPSKYTKNIEES